MPNTFELFSPQVTGLQNFAEDPCAGAAPGSNADLRAVCLAQGADPTFIGSIIVDPAGQVNATSGGNPNLGAEDADTWTIGAVFRPDFIPGLVATHFDGLVELLEGMGQPFRRTTSLVRGLDYYNITVTGAITTPTEDDVFQACFGPDYANGNLTIDGNSATDPNCTGIRRNPATGNLFGELATTPGLPLFFSNQGRIFTDGIDLTLAYSTDLTADIGWSSNFGGNWTNSEEFQSTPAGVNRDCVGLYSTNCGGVGSGALNPEFTFNWRNTVTYDKFAVSLNWQYLSSMDAEIPASFQEEFTSIPAFSYFDLSIQADVDPVVLTLGVQNLFDVQPPIVGSSLGSTAFNAGDTFPSTYAVRGRSYAATVQMSF